MSLLSFVKMHGLGNDFLVVDFRHDSPVSRDLAGLAPLLCDRHFGVGADGILVILPSTRAFARMQVLNADGSEAEMCGNGLRCMARYLWDHDPAPRPAPLELETGAGVLTCTPILDPHGDPTAVEITMGAPTFTDPLSGPPDDPVTLEDRTFPITSVSLGNPHAVIFFPPDDPANPAPSLRHLAAHYGPLIETHPRFPHRTNVEFARIHGGVSPFAIDHRGASPFAIDHRGASPFAIDLVVWERGCGITLACGTGACATAAAACRLGFFPLDQPIEVRLPGGPLSIRVTTDFANILMTGPAREVFRGQLDLSRFPAVSL